MTFQAFWDAVTFGKITLHCVKKPHVEFLAQFSADQLCASS